MAAEMTPEDWVDLVHRDPGQAVEQAVTVALVAIMSGAETLFTIPDRDGVYVVRAWHGAVVDTADHEMVIAINDGVWKVVEGPYTGGTVHRAARVARINRGWLELQFDNVRVVELR